MADEKISEIEQREQEVEQMIAEADAGGRHPSGLPAKVLFIAPLLWSLFQLYYASPLPFMLSAALRDFSPALASLLVLNDSEARSIHLTFAVFIAYLAFPAMKRSPRDYIPIQDWVLAFIAAFCASYLYVFYEELAGRPGLPTTLDLIVAIAGLITLLEATRRALGPPLMVVAGVFLIYAFAGPFMPDVIAHKGASLNKGMSHYWLSTEGVFGVALGVSTSMVFMFVLFGAMLEHAGAGNYFIRVAFALLGHMRGGPAKAAVVSSAMTGLISGSSIANVVTTGTFTIPLMKKVGFPAEKAGAVEVASSTNGQLTPPIMGAAAFLMIEYVGISYIEVITHAFLPAISAYIALVYIVHLEAMKANMQGLPRRTISPFMQKLMTFVFVVGGIIILSGVIYYGLSWTKDVAGDATPYIAALVLLVAYVALVRNAAKVPDLPTSHEISEIPEVGPTVKSGLHFLLPIVVLVWCLVVERLSPGLSAFWAAMFMIFVVITHRQLKVFFRKQQQTELSQANRQGFTDLIDGMVAGARNMIGIGVATAAAGIVVGTVTITGVGLVMTEFVEFISGGNLILMLLLTAFISLILGMGLPTTANYIVVSTLMAPVIVSLGAANGLIVPLIAVHLFVFYFGILADDTPPVGLAAYAAAAISQGDPIRTGIQGFTYDIRTAILPFMFIFNTELIMIGITGPIHLLFVVFGCMAGMMAFSAATQGFFLVRNTALEGIMLLVISFTFFQPGYWWDKIYPPLEESSASQILNIIDDTPADGQLRVRVAGETLEGKLVDKTVMLQMAAAESAEDRLNQAGLELREEDGKWLVDNIVFGSPAEKAGIDFDWEIKSIQTKTNRPPKQLMYGPAIVLFLLLYFLQRQRRVDEKTFYPGTDAGS
ncbi:MAG: TRAP transporter permease [Gammaproteobacteria bacterium]|nr:TRAP transporter permease [Gammaproteobacteria bacterium]